MNLADAITACDQLSAYLKTLQPAPPSEQRVRFGYFGATASQVDETADHVGVHMEPFWDGLDGGILNIKRAALPTIIVVSSELYGSGGYLGADKSQAMLRQKFNYMADRGALANVYGLWVGDELEKQGITADDVRFANRYLRWVMEQYPALMDGDKHKPLIMGYSPDENYIALDDVDIAGFNAYGERGDIFSNGRYDRFRSRLRADQRALLIPGGCDSNDGTLWRADPQPFVDKAMRDKQVALILPFIWLDGWANNLSNKGIRSNGMADAYRGAGKTIKETA